LRSMFLSLDFVSSFTFLLCYVMLETIQNW
jgi:hypothetical protein